MDIGAHRASRLRAAVVTSLASKVLGALAQVLTLPLVLSGLGEVRFAAFVAVTALVQWAAPMQLGVLPSLTRELAAAAATGDRRTERDMAGVGVWFCLVIGLILFGLSMAGAFVFDPAAIAGVDGEVSAAEVKWAFVAATSVMSLQLFASVSSALRAGYQESWVSNIWAIVANITVIAGTVTASRTDASIAAFVMAIYAPITLFSLLDIGLIAWRRKYLLPLARPTWSMLRGGALVSFVRLSGVAWVAQLHYMLTVFGTTSIMSHMHVASDTAAYGAMMRAMVLGNSAIGLVSWPLVPAVADALTRGDRVWARMAALRMLGATLAAALLGGAVIAFFGPMLLRVWLGDELTVPPGMAWGFGLYFAAWSMTFVSFNLCVSLSATRGIPAILIGEMMLLVMLIALLQNALGPSAVAIALGLASASVSGWLLPRRVLKAVSGKRLATDSGAA